MVPFLSFNKGPTQRKKPRRLPAAEGPAAAEEADDAPGGGEVRSMVLCGMEVFEPPDNEGGITVETLRIKFNHPFKDERPKVSVALCSIDAKQTVQEQATMEFAALGASVGEHTDAYFDIVVKYAPGFTTRKVGVSWLASPARNRGLQHGTVEIPWRSDSQRCYSGFVEFQSKFKYLPKVRVALAMVNATPPVAMRSIGVEVRVDACNPSGFAYTVRNMGDYYLRGANVTWIATDDGWSAVDENAIVPAGVFIGNNFRFSGSHEP